MNVWSSSEREDVNHPDYSNVEILSTDNESPSVEAIEKRDTIKAMKAREHRSTRVIVEKDASCKAEIASKGPRPAVPNDSDRAPPTPPTRMLSNHTGATDQALLTSTLPSKRAVNLLPQDEVIQRYKTRVDLRKTLSRVPSTIAFDDSGFEFLDEDDVAELEKSAPGLKSPKTPTSDFIKKLAAYSSDSGDGIKESEETTRRKHKKKEKKSKSKKKKKRQEDKSHRTKSNNDDANNSSLVMEELGFAFEDALAEPGSPLACSQRKTLGEQLAKIEKEDNSRNRDALSRYSDSVTAPSSCMSFSDARSDAKSMARSLAMSEETKPSGSLSASKSASRLATKYEAKQASSASMQPEISEILKSPVTQGSRTLSNIHSHKPRESTNSPRRSLRHFIEDNTSKGLSSRGAKSLHSFSLVDSTSQAPSTFSGDLMTKSLDGGAISERKKRKKKSKRRSRHRSPSKKNVESQTTVGNFSTKSPSKMATAASPRSNRSSGKRVVMLRRRSSVRSIRSIKAKWDNYVDNDTTTKKVALETELLKIKGVIRQRKNHGNDDETYNSSHETLDVGKGQDTESGQFASMQSLEKDWKKYIDKDAKNSVTKHLTLRRQLKAIKDLRKAQKSQSTSRKMGLKG